MKQAKVTKNMKVVTSNDFITAVGLSDLTLKARKLLYIAIAQCRKDDHEFYEYSFTVKEFAEHLDIASANIYASIDSITTELMKTIVSFTKDGSENFYKTTMFHCCYYDGKQIVFKFNKDMGSMLLQLKGGFMQPLLEDFLKMGSKYSMSIWHLFQREMKSRKPSVTQEMNFYLSLMELRQVTGTENVFKQVGQFKQKVLDKAISEIKEKCFVNVKYTNRKNGKTIVGFDFVATSNYHIDEENISPDIIEHVREVKEKLGIK